MKVISFLGLCLLFTSVQVYSADKKCDSLMQSYYSTYGGYNGNKAYSDKQRLSRLNQIAGDCKANAIHSVYLSKVLLRLGEADKALEVLNKSINRKAQPVGDLFYSKASLMHDMTSSGFKSFPLTEIKNLFLKALNSDNSVKALIYMELGETLIDMNAFDEAAYYLMEGAKLDSSIRRFWTLGAIMESKRGNYAKAAEIMTQVIKVSGESYMEEPDTVFATVKTLCMLGKKQLAIGIVNKAFERHPEKKVMPDMKKAYQYVAQRCG